MANAHAQANDAIRGVKETDVSSVDAWKHKQIDVNG